MYTTILSRVKIILITSHLILFHFSFVPDSIASGEQNSSKFIYWINTGSGESRIKNYPPFITNIGRMV